jgi:hypothetical protein
MTRRAEPDDKMCLSDGVTAREFDGDWILLDLQGGNYFGLDEVGGLVWRHLSAGRSLAEIADLIAGEYDAPRGVILDDIVRLVDELLERRLVRVDE